MDISHFLSYAVGGTTVGGGVYAAGRILTKAVKAWTSLVESVRDLTVSLRSHVDTETTDTANWRSTVTNKLTDIDGRVTAIESGKGNTSGSSNVNG